jgi:hypothetical protein
VHAFLRNLRCLAIGVGFSSASLAGAEPMVATTYRFKGTSASASMSQGDTCVQRSLYVNATESVARVTPEPSTTPGELLELQYNYGNWCTGETVRINASIPNPGGTVLRKELDRASLRFEQNVEVERCISAGGAMSCSTSSLPFKVRINWEGGDDFSDGTSRERSNVDGYLVERRYNGQQRSAIISQVVKLDGHLLPFYQISAAMNFNRNGEITWTPN